MSISIVINNYNYGRFLGEAIRSALDQSAPALEVIVVDDGSTDNSREIIESFGDRIIPIFQSNGGQAAAFNSGIRAAKGEWVWLLDADDTLIPGALESTRKWIEPGISRIAMGLQNISSTGKPIGLQMPNQGREFTGTLYDAMIRQGALIGTPTSGNLFLRSALCSILPVPEAEFRICADAYLFVMSAIHGKIKVVPELVANYRIHGANNYATEGKRSHEASVILRQLSNALRIDTLLKAYGAILPKTKCRRISKFWQHDQILPLVLRAKSTGGNAPALDAWPWRRIAFGYLLMIGSSPLPMKKRAKLCKQFIRITLKSIPLKNAQLA